MTWTTPGSRRLPPDWKKRVKATRERDGHRCVAILTNGTRCPATTNLECDHIGDPDDHSLDNLRTLCVDHHRIHTHAQSRAARPRRQRPPTKHPGLLD